MKRKTPESTPPIPADTLLSDGPEAPSIETKLQLVDHLRRSSPEASGPLDRFLLEHTLGSRAALRAARSNLRRLEKTLAQLSAPPQVAAVCLAVDTSTSGPRALVADGRSRRVVPIVEEVQPESLRIGDEVLLSQDLSLLVSRSSWQGTASGLVARVQRALPGHRLLLDAGPGEEVIVAVVESLRDDPLSAGDLVRWDPDLRLARERIERTDRDDFTMEEVPDIPLHRVGGQATNLRRLLNALSLALTAPELARQYDLTGQRCILMVGPPGNGKTLMAQVAAAQVQRLSGRRCRLCVVKPGQFEDPFVGVTQQRIRGCFDSLRRGGEPGLLFLDEIESIGRMRGSGLSHHGDRFLAALLAELQGFQESGPEPLAVIAATNRLDLLDPALVERMEIQLHVDRPDRRAAREILSIHLPDWMPYRKNGTAASSVREALIERVLGLFYGPNADNGISNVQFRDGTRRLVTARDLASGRCFQQICRAARQSAAFREMEGGESGLCGQDIDQALVDARARLARTLTRHNIHAYITDLPQDLDVVSVAPVSRRVEDPGRYRSVA